MKIQQKSGTVLICLATLILVAAIAIAGVQTTVRASRAR